MNYKVGRFTVAGALIVVGAALIYDNLTGAGLSWSLFRLWPALLIALGLEWIIASAASETPVHADGGAITLLIVGAIVLGVLSGAWQTARGIDWAWNGSGPRATFLGGDSYTSDTVETTSDLDLSNLSHLMISGGSAQVTVMAGDAPTLRLRVQARGRSPEEAAENARRVRLNVESGTTTKVGLDMPSGNYSRLEIYALLPASVKVTVNSSSGTVEVADRRADVTLSSSSGALRAERIEGDVDLRASSGSITAWLITGDLNAISSSGRIRIEQVDGDVEASATSGSISVSQATGQVSAHTNSGSIDVESNAVGGPYDLGAASGSVRLTIPESARVEVEARSSSGSVSGPRWLTLGEGRGSASGTQGDGTHRVTLRTTSGSISITNR